MLAVGIAFTVGIFVTYLGLGLGAFSGLERLRAFGVFSKYFDMGVGFFTVALGIISLYDYIYFKRTGQTKGILLQLPRSVKNAIHRSVRGVDSRSGRRLPKILLAALSVGVVVSLLESMCTGQIYLPTITFILRMKVMWWRAFLFLLLYNAMFILPLVVVLLATLFGVTSQWWAGFLQRHMAKVKLATAVLFFSLGAFLIFK